MADWRRLALWAGVSKSSEVIAGVYGGTADLSTWSFRTSSRSKLCLHKGQTDFGRDGRHLTGSAEDDGRQ